MQVARRFSDFVQLKRLLLQALPPPSPVPCPSSSSPSSSSSAGSGQGLQGRGHCLPPCWDELSQARGVLGAARFSSRCVQADFGEGVQGERGRGGAQGAREEVWLAALLCVHCCVPGGQQARTGGLVHTRVHLHLCCMMWITAPVSEPGHVAARHWSRTLDPHPHTHTHTHTHHTHSHHSLPCPRILDSRQALLQRCLDALLPALGPSPALPSSLHSPEAATILLHFLAAPPHLHPASLAPSGHAGCAPAAPASPIPPHKTPQPLLLAAGAGGTQGRGPAEAAVRSAREQWAAGGGLAGTRQAGQLPRHGGDGSQGGNGKVVGRCACWGARAACNAGCVSKDADSAELLLSRLCERGHFC